MPLVEQVGVVQCIRKTDIAGADAVLESGKADCRWAVVLG
jgi:hypothetical protein